MRIPDADKVQGALPGGAGEIRRRLLEHVPGLKSLSVGQGLLVAARWPPLCGVFHYPAKI